MYWIHQVQPCSYSHKIGKINRNGQEQIVYFQFGLKLFQRQEIFFQFCFVLLLIWLNHTIEENDSYSNLRRYKLLRSDYFWEDTWSVDYMPDLTGESTSEHTTVCYQMWKAEAGECGHKCIKEIKKKKKDK